MHGVQLYVTDRDKFEAVKTGLSVIKTIHDLYPEDFEFLSTGSFDKLAGNGWIRTKIKNGTSIENIINSYEKTLQQFSKTMSRVKFR